MDSIIHIHNPNLFFAQLIQLTHETTNRLIDSIDLPLQGLFLLRQPWTTSMQFEHVLHERDHSIVLRFVGGIGGNPGDSHY
jgi:hypothetical protein